MPNLCALRESPPGTEARLTELNEVVAPSGDVAAKASALRFRRLIHRHERARSRKSARSCEAAGSGKPAGSRKHAGIRKSPAATGIPPKAVGFNLGGGMTGGGTHVKEGLLNICPRTLVPDEDVLPQSPCRGTYPNLRVASLKADVIWVSLTQPLSRPLPLWIMVLGSSGQGLSLIPALLSSLLISSSMSFAALLSVWKCMQAMARETLKVTMVSMPWSTTSGTLRDRQPTTSASFPWTVPSATMSRLSTTGRPPFRTATSHESWVTRAISPPEREVRIFA